MAWSDAARAAALEVRRRRSMVTMYHGTSAGKAQKILREGFRPFRAGNRYADDAYAGSPRFATYLSKSKAWAKTFAARVSLENRSKQAGVILAVRLPARKVIGEGGDFHFARGVSKHRIIGTQRLSKGSWYWKDERRQRFSDGRLR